MKIGILTFHYMINQGSVLQAYCVYSLLKKNLPDAEVEVIDLIPENRGKNEKQFYRKKPPFINFKWISKFRSIRNFLEKRVPLSPHCSSQVLAEQIDFINRQKYDCIFTGSDTVWMHSPKLGNLLPHIYFLPEGILGRKFSIAASVDPIINKADYHKQKEIITKNLNDYEYITVRDQVTYKLMQDLGVTGLQRIADPTLLYDFENDLKIPINKTTEIRKKNVFIFVTDTQISQQIEKLLKETGDFTFVKEKTPLFGYDHMLDYLNGYANVDILITDRFHRSIFGMKLSNALVINVERYNKNPTPESKGRDLFECLGMPEYCIRFEAGENTEFKARLLKLIEEWNKSKFEEREVCLNGFIQKNHKVWQETLAQIKTLKLEL